ncbi:hypothetical protein MES5069_620106 [Mesorhizobium escarrei]|uniref:Uncharacterized protein n=1 Tax=Mesorhizobium escarrei TaxID=666018 RepID=A0ABM9EF27_9HYPH|nr:hypothetical protein MES5069_620106 [Mesorhizobium escarrei]
MSETGSVETCRWTLKRVAFERIHATRLSSCFVACRHRKTAAHPRFKPEGMLFRDMH